MRRIFSLQKLFIQPTYKSKASSYQRLCNPLYSTSLLSPPIHKLFSQHPQQFYCTIRSKSNSTCSKEKEKKNLRNLDEYVAIGFDADHCLLRYKLGGFFKMLYKTLAKFLVEEKSYPIEMLEFGKKEKSFIMNGLVIDFETAYLLKLGENKVITRAYYGYERVSREELEARYGNPPKYEIFDPYHCQTDRYLCCLTFFECFVPALLTHMVEFKKKIHHPEQINVKEILDDCWEAWKNTGHIYLKNSCAEIDSLVYKQDKLRQILLNLKGKEKILFIASNAPAQYIEFFMAHAFGKDWKSIFDFVIANSDKPRFFSEQDTPFYEIGKSYEKLETPLKELHQHQLYMGGNAKLLEENIARINNDKTGRVLFFGDHYSTDILAAEKIDHWDGVCIMEELGDVDFGEGYDTSHWGHWQYEETPYGKIPTFWYSYMSKNVALCTALVDSIDLETFYEMPRS